MIKIAIFLIEKITISVIFLLYYNYDIEILFYYNYF